jgi:hypothetical protein
MMSAACMQMYVSLNNKTTASEGKEKKKTIKISVYSRCMNDPTTQSYSIDTID